MIILVLVYIIVAISILQVNIVNGQDDTYKVTWEQCVDMYDEITCAIIEDHTVNRFGKTFNHTETD